MTIELEELKACTKVSDPQLAIMIEDSDIIVLTPHFDNVKILCLSLGLDEADQQDVEDIVCQFDIKTGVGKALRLWQKANPGTATFRALVEVVLRMNDLTIAGDICDYLYIVTD